jgi:hypothetical protein
MRSIQTEKWNAEEENMKQGKQNRKNYKTTNNWKTWIMKRINRKIILNTILCFTGQDTITS